MLAEGNETDLQVEFGQGIGRFISRPSATFQEI
jgi:hypothetical protein